MNGKLLRFQWIFWIVGAAGLGVPLGYFWATPENMAASYLLAFLYWFGICVGSLVPLCFHTLTGGIWGKPVRRLFESVVVLVPVMFLLFIPLVFFMDHLYPWLAPEWIHHDESGKQIYLNKPFFLLRAAIYFLIWTLSAFLLFLRSRKGKKVEALGGIALVAYALTLTFASVDWIMSLDPHWYSTAFGLIVMTGFAMSGFAFSVVAAVMMRGVSPFKEIEDPKKCHELGNMLFAFVLFWTYIYLAQFIIIWYGNLPEETSWYLVRFNGGWGWLGVALAVFHFFVPFIVLLMRRIKKRHLSLVWVAVLVLVMQWVNLIWMIKPAFFPNIQLDWTDIFLWLGVGGIWLGALAGRLKKEMAENL